MTQSVEPQVALVTGAATGIGLAVARLLLERGVRVALCDRDAARLAESAAELRAAGFDKLESFVLDVGSRAEVGRVARAAEDALGPIDALASVAGILRLGHAVSLEAQGVPGSVLSETDWADSLQTNSTGLFHLAQAIVPGMVQRRRGSVVAVASNAARTPRMQMAAYAASKAATVMYAKCLGLEVAQYGVRCNVVSPGSTYTDMQRMLWSDDTGPRLVIDGDLASYRNGIPLGRIAEPRDIAEVVAFLLSERAKHVTLQDVCVDGGATL